MPIQFANNATSLTAYPLLAGDTYVTIEAGDVWMFPAPDPGLGNYFYATLEDRRIVPTRREIVKVINRSGATYTILRGQDNTAAYDFFTGAIFSHRLNAAALHALINEEAAARIAADAAEAAARAAADANLQSQITAEINARIAGDANLQAQLNAEITRAQNAEAALQSQISGLGGTYATQAALNAEITARTNADTYLQGEIVTAVNDRIAGDAYLQSEIDALTGIAPPTIPKLLHGHDISDASGHKRVTFTSPFPTEPAVAIGVGFSGFDITSAMVVTDVNGFDVWFAYPQPGVGAASSGARSFYWIATNAG